MTIRNPLIHRELNAEERTRLNPDLTPKDRSPLEAEADRLIAGDKPVPELAVTDPVTPVTKKPLIPEKVAKVLGMVGFALTFAVMLPFPPYSTGVAIFGGLLVIVSGGALPQFKFLAGKPVLTGSALVVGGIVCEQLAVFVYNLPPGLPFNVGFLVLVALCFLTGKAAPSPTRKVAEG